MKFLIINGPNLNFLGKREVDIYGSISFEDYFKTLQRRFHLINLSFIQNNQEGSIIDAIQEANNKFDAIIINPGAYSHTSIAIADAIESIKIPTVEVHISNIYARESYRHTSFTGAKCIGVISGFGLESYALAIEYLSHNTKKKK